MKWVDYRKKLGIGFDDNQKFNMLSAILINYVKNVIGDNFDEDSYLEYCQMVGEDIGSVIIHIIIFEIVFITVNQWKNLLRNILLFIMHIPINMWGMHMNQ